MINGPENIQSIFNIFHDGSIALGELAGETLRTSPSSMSPCTMSEG